MEDEDKDRQAIVDRGALGNEPSADYLERVAALDNVVRECMHVSNAYGGIQAPTSQHFYASLLFTALVTRGVSLANLVPHSPWATKLIEHWDYASVAGIVRTMLELRIAFYYLCTDECGRDEWECRWNVFNLHDCSSRRRMFEAMPRGGDEVAGFELQAEELRDRLRANEYFRSLPAKAQNKLLHGQTAYTQSLEDIGVRAGVDRNVFRWLYVLLSSHVHGLPMSFYRMGTGESERGRGLPSPVEEGYTSLCLSFAITLLVRSRDEVTKMFSALHRPNPNPNPESAANADSTPATKEQTTEALPVGQSKDLLTTESIRIEVTRTTDDRFEFAYYFLPTNNMVLRRSDSEEAGSVLDWFDPVFWGVTVDGGPATEAVLAKLSTTRHAFRVDADSRTVSFKTM
jgi:hypothetical protein